MASPCNPGVDSQVSITSLQCRICYESDKNEDLIAPCQCKGTVAFVHRSCLERWLSESNNTACELCHVIFHTERVPKYTSRQSVWQWFRHHRTPRGVGRGVRSDIIACTIITPVAIIITYACLFSSEYYNNQKRNVLLPAARWTSISLLIMVGMMLLGYYIWLYSVIRMHSRLWFNWWQRDCIIRYIPPSNPAICCRPAEAVGNNNAAVPDTNSLEVGNVEDENSAHEVVEIGDVSQEQEANEENVKTEIVTIDVKVSVESIENESKE